MNHPDKKPCPKSGFAAGALAGLAGAAAKAVAEVVYPPRIEGQRAPPIVMLRKLTKGRLDSESEQIAMRAIHFGFGALAGGVYGILAEYWRPLTSGRGAAFGTALNLLTQESALPILWVVGRTAEANGSRTDERSDHACGLWHGYRSHEGTSAE